MDPLSVRGMTIPSSDGAYTFDVYARPFVPEELRSINLQPATVLNSHPSRAIPYDAYASSFIPPLFLQRRPTMHELAHRRPDHERRRLGSIMPSNLKDYAFYFCHCLKEEARALERDIASLALYRAHLEVYQQPDGCHLRLYVPGLRENSPRIELDDVISLRQLTVQVTWNGMPQIAFTGFQYNVPVEHIDRPNEIVVLRVDIDHAHTLTPNSTLFNVCFNAPYSEFDAQQASLATIQDCLDLDYAQDGQQEDSSATNCAVTHDAFESGHSSGHQSWADKTLYTSGRMLPVRTAGQEVLWLRKMLFPEDSDGAMQTELTRLAERKLFDEQLNFEQQKAVDSVCKRNYGDVPFLISGPPGTGKTKTMVECVLQLVSNDSHRSHILLCAPSDPAADTLAQRLSQHLEFGDFLRLNSPKRTFAEVPENLMAHCFVENDHFGLPPLPQLMRYKVVVTTCRDAAMLVSARVTNKDLFALEFGVISALHRHDKPREMTLHWGALLIDEAAQATEPEAAVPISVVAPPDDNKTVTSKPILVMAGDEMQLGPRAKISALRTSLFERLFKRPLYKDHPLARNKKTPGAPPKPLNKTMLPIMRAPFSNLIRNYRSHPAILAVPSALFYYDTLVPEASGTDALHSWGGWQGRGWPVLFKTNTGADEIESEGGGWYNKAEARVACDCALSLAQSGLVREREICIMSPFRAQVRVLRAMMRTQPYGMWSVNIGPMEAFQGLESRVVIICTTRTRTRFLEQDWARDLGIVREPKRFNVALTRAREGLVVIGNPHVLATDPCWAAFLSFCRRNELWTGEQGGAGSQEADGVPLGPGPGTVGDNCFWQQPPGAEAGGERRISVLETGLVTKEEIRQDITSDYARFMAAGTDEEMWVTGMLAALAMDEQDSAEGDRSEKDGAYGNTRGFVDGEAGDERNGRSE